MVRGKTRPIDRPKLDYDIGAKIHNRFDVEVIDARTGKVRQTCQGHNVICNQLWTKWFLKNTWNSYIFYGSGEGTPSAGDTKLFNRIGYAESSVHAVNSNSDEHWVSYTKKIQLSESTAVGTKISEVGIAYGSTETNLCTHAMLQDMNGNPISIEKTDTDIINIYATVFVHWTPTSAFKIFNWKGAPASSGLGAFAGLSSSPFYNRGAFITKGILSRGFDSSTPSGYISLSTALDTQNKKFTATFNRLSVSQHNTKGLHHMVLYYIAKTKESYPFTYKLWKPWASVEFPSDQVAAVPIVGEAVGTGDGETTQFVTKFPYAQNATVYVDGVAVSGVMVNPNTFPKDYSMKDYLEEVWISGSGGNAAFNSISREGFPTSSFQDNQFTTGSGEFYVFYNPHHEIGIASAYVYNADIYASNDLKTWEPVFINLDSYGTKTIPDQFIHYKYWRLNTKGGNGDWTFETMNPPSTYNPNNIIFDEPPAEGAVITIDYTPQCIPKDENHVFDLSVTFHFGEYTEV